MKMMGGGAKVMQRTILTNWFGCLEALREENKILDELDAHRRGRSQLIMQYRELEGELVNERQRSQDYRHRLEEVGIATEHMSKELADSSKKLDRQTREMEELRTQVRTLQEQVGESQDKISSLKRDLRKETEKNKRISHDLEDAEKEKHDLAEQVIRAEQLVEEIKAQTGAHDAKVEQYERMLEEKNRRLDEHKSMLGKYHGCIEQLSRGANDFLDNGSVRGYASEAPSLRGGRGDDSPPPRNRELRGRLDSRGSFESRGLLARDDGLDALGPVEELAASLDRSDRRGERGVDQGLLAIEPR